MDKPDPSADTHENLALFRIGRLRLTCLKYFSADRFDDLVLRRLFFGVVAHELLDPVEAGLAERHLLSRVLHDLGAAEELGIGGRVLHSTACPKHAGGSLVARPVLVQVKRDV